jgi:hypothetical protein
MTTYEETKKLLNDSAFYYIICTDMDGNYSYVNNHYQTKFAGIHGTILGRPYHITMHPQDMRICQEVAEQCFLHPEKTFPATIRKHDGKGGYVITQWEYKALFDENGHPAGVFCLGYDITDFVHERVELKETKKAIERKNSILKEIAFDQAHLIRRPLANIMGIGLILENMEMDQNMRNLCNMMIESSHQLDEVIRSIVNKTYAE